MGRTIRIKEYSIIIEKLTQARLDAGLTQVEVAKKLKRPQSYVSKCEAGEQRVDILEFKKFAELYKRLGGAIGSIGKSIRNSPRL